MKLKKRYDGIATNSIILALVQCVTLCTGIVQTMILSRVLTKLEYGTYSEGMLIISFTVPFLLLGLNNAITYFTGQINIDVQQYIGFLFSIILFLGLLGAAIIFGLQQWIILYFDNPLLQGIMIFVAIRPLLQNLITAYQTLYIANGLSVLIAIRNLIISVAQVMVIFFGAYLVNDIKIIFAMLIALDIVQLVLFASYFNRNRFKIKFAGKIRKEQFIKIFSFSIPLAIASMVGTLSIYMDKLLIGRMMGTEDFALYSNMSKELPFSFIVTSFTTVVTPVMVKLQSRKCRDELIHIWKNYLELGYRMTWILCGGAIVCSKELLKFLYSDRYINGYWIFVVYLCISALRFSYFGVVLSAYGKTRQIMIFSIATLAANLVLNYLLFSRLGMIGPAIASFIVIFLMNMLQSIYSCRLLQCSLLYVLDIKELVMLIGELLVVGAIVSFIKNFASLGTMISLIVFAGIYIGILLLLNIKKIRRNISILNSHSIT